MSILQQGIVPASAGGYEIEQSLRFNDDDSAYLSWTPSSAGNRKTWTWSGWIKGSATGTDQTVFTAEDGSDTASCMIVRKGDGNFQLWQNGNQPYFRTSALYRDPSAWYHLVVAIDTTQATESNRVKIYVNGEQVTDFTSATYPSQNQEPYINSATRHDIGNKNYLGSDQQYLDGYLAEVNFIDGQALDPSNFGETGDYGEWKPIKYTGTYGTNGFYLDFENSGSLGADVSGNGNNWTPTNLAATDQMLDSPTNNFATLNPLYWNPTRSNTPTYSEGNLKAGYNTDCMTEATIGAPSGKWY